MPSSFLFQQRRQSARYMEARDERHRERIFSSSQKGRPPPRATMSRFFMLSFSSQRRGVTARTTPSAQPSCFLFCSCLSPSCPSCFSCLSEGQQPWEGQVMGKGKWNPSKFSPFLSHVSAGHNSTHLHAYREGRQEAVEVMLATGSTGRVKNGRHATRT